MSRRPTLTVLTTPVLPATRRVYQRARGLVRRLVKPGVPLPRPSPYPGHYAVTRSVVEGLRAIGADFNFNPTRFRDVAPIVYAPANEALLQAIEFKRQGRISYLAAGPVNALFPDDAGGILLHSEIDRLFVASAWVLDLLETPADVRPKCRVCPCGVNPEYFKPSGHIRDTAIVYCKSAGQDFGRQVEAVVRRHNLEPIMVSVPAGDRGRFTPAWWRERLDRALVAIFLSRSETQGIALAEAWSMDVPTVVWNPREEIESGGRRFRAGSSCPYLTVETGRDWKTLEELDAVLHDVLASRDALQPRKWVLGHMTDAIRSRALYETLMDDARQSSSAGIAR